MNEWNPVGTAPKDGSEFIAAYGHQGFAKQLVHWDKLHARWMSKGRIVHGFEENVTHWLKIPPNPKT